MIFLVFSYALKDLFDLERFIRSSRRPSDWVFRIGVSLGDSWNGKDNFWLSSFRLKFFFFFGSKGRRRKFFDLLLFFLYGFIFYRFFFLFRLFFLLFLLSYLIFFRFFSLFQLSFLLFLLSYLNLFWFLQFFRFLHHRFWLFFNFLINISNFKYLHGRKLFFAVFLLLDPSLISHQGEINITAYLQRRLFQGLDLELLNFSFSHSILAIFICEYEIRRIMQS